jgi:hypothetical protein
MLNLVEYKAIFPFEDKKISNSEIVLTSNNKSTTTKRDSLHLIDTAERLLIFS